ncbi:amidohydrolase family protein [Occultella kanbiaonis]|uniref:amidohydrolase family protein n=1 Tax=Occultella kanbiaonis TaxID=2675754 RepID=UPI0013D076E6|nr:amidohydrolase family protein [Occultella kanbiaonis]
MIIDAHAHAWARWPYPAAVPDPLTRGSVGSLLYEMDAAGVDRALVVCAGIGAGEDRTDNTGNNDYVLAAAATHPDRLSVALDVDSRWTNTYHLPGAPGRLARALAEAGDAVGQVAGVTHYLADETDDWFGGDDAAGFLSTLAEHGLLLSLHARPAWFGAVAAAARAHPDVPVLIHHQGHVDADAPAEVAALRDLATVANVYVKVSGFHHLTERTWDFPYSDRRVLADLLEHFGSRRLVWGSDFPVSRPHLTYRQALETVRSYSGLDGGSSAAVLGGTMAGLLGLPGLTGAVSDRAGAVTQ